MRRNPAAHTQFTRGPNPAAHRGSPRRGSPRKDERIRRDTSPISHTDFSRRNRHLERGPNHYVRHHPNFHHPPGRDVYMRNHIHQQPLPMDYNLIHRDHITHLYNRPYFNNYLHRYYVPNDTFIILVKINNLDNNDVEFHENTLVQAANAINIAYPNLFVSKYSDDKFAILIPNSTPAFANAVAQGVYNTLNNTVITTPGGVNIKLDATVFVTRTDGTANDLINAANIGIVHSNPGLTLI